MREDHTQAPLVDAVRSYREADTLPFTTPGHKRGTGITAESAAALGLDAFRNDVPLGAGIDDSHFSRDLLGRAERLAADAFGADRSFFLVNGSSIGNQAAILALAAPGEQIVVARNAHSSILAALILGGARPVYVQPRYDPDLEVAHGVDVADLAATLDAHPRARAVVLTSPSYFGVASDLPRLAALCHERGLPLHVDEAWAAHFPFHPDLPPSAMQAGADSAVTSIHKLLTGFGQSALLNVRAGLIDPDAVARWLRLLQTTSPSALILASIDASRRQMMLEGYATAGSHPRPRRDGPRADRRAAWAAGHGSGSTGAAGCRGLDPTKLVIDVAGTGHTGYWVEAWLRARAPDHGGDERPSPGGGAALGRRHRGLGGQAARRAGNVARGRHPARVTAASIRRAIWRPAWLPRWCSPPPRHTARRHGSCRWPTLRGRSVPRRSPPTRPASRCWHRASGSRSTS